MVIYLTPKDFNLALSRGAFHLDFRVAPAFFPGDKITFRDESAMHCAGKSLQGCCTGIYAPGEGPAISQWRVTFNCSELTN